MSKKSNKPKRHSPLLHRLKLRIKRYYKRLVRIFAIVLCAIIVFFGVKACLKTRQARPNRTTTYSKDYNGIDVSKHNGRINWAKVAADKRIQFVYIKATEGATRTDGMYNTNIKKAREQGIKVGSYHYFISWRTAQEQFNNFCRNVAPDEQDLIPMVDVEEQGCRSASRSELQKNLNEFMRLVKQEYGVYPLLYSQYHFYNEKLAPEFNKYHIFMARYGSKRPILKGQGNYNIWQFTENGRIAGINTAVDLDRFDNGTTLSDIELN